MGNDSDDVLNIAWHAIFKDGKVEWLEYNENDRDI